MVRVITGHRACEPGGFPLTNENPAIVRELVAEIRPKYAAGISSGGEMPLLALLPNSEHVFAFDASNEKSILGTAAKARALEIQGAGIKETIGKGEGYLRDFLEREVFLSLDPSLANRYMPGEHWHVMTSGGRWNYDKFRDIWTETPDNVLDASREKLGNLTIANKYAEDLEMDGAFDLVYASNAWINTRVRHFTRLARDDGHIVVSTPIEMRGLVLLKSVTESNKSTWVYNLYKTEKAATSPTAVYLHAPESKDKSSSVNLAV